MALTALPWRWLSIRGAIEEFGVEYFLDEDQEIEAIARKSVDGKRLSGDEGLRLYENASLHLLGALADHAKRRHCGDDIYFCVNRHVNYTDYCINECNFCAYYKKPGSSAGRRLSTGEIMKMLDSGYREFHIVGGCDPEPLLSYYLEMLSKMKKAYPDTRRQCFTAVEIAHIAKIAGMSVDDCLDMLIAAGLEAIPGGGAEIFDPEIRQKICPNKISGDEYLDVHRKAHGKGIKSNCTMLYGHIEEPRHRIDHLVKLRELQDETGGFLAFIPLSFHPENTKYENLKGPSGLEDLRTIAISRLMLDNIPHIKAFWIMLGLKLAQVALHFGADDLDGTVVEERITHRAGAETPVGIARNEIIRLIKGAGLVPVERDTLYKTYWRGDNR
jgi:aminodeoxyfutalosine synthase